ncbi:MAG: excinuclease ABC subunit UvrC, partial [Mycobacteriales bacterium]
IDKCSAPCVGRVSADEHREIVDDFCDFMAGRTDQLVKRLDREMRRAADDQEYERAARLRDDLGAVQRAVEKQAVVLGDGTDADVIALAQDALEAAVSVFYVRGGRVRGQRGWVVDVVDDLDTGALVSQFLEQVYGSELEGEQEQAALDAELRRRKPVAGSGAPGLLDPVHDAAAYRPGPDAPKRRRHGSERDIPREVLVPALPDDAPALEDWLSALRGSRVLIRVPQRGDKRALLDTVRRNAQESFQQHKLKRAGDLSARSRALADLQEALDLPTAPLRIECYDVSHVQGTDVVASMVVFEDGLARKSEYRRFALKGVDGNDDTAWMHEVITRRFRRLVLESAESDASAAGPIDPETGRPRKFAYPPQLVVVDGGPPQVEAARRAMHEVGVDGGPDPVALCGLAKRLEEVWLPLAPDPVILPRTSEALYLLQRVRDEAHRFAIAYHRQRRSRSMTVSALDGVPGLGDTRRKALLRHFGSVKKMRAATVDEVAAVPGVGPATAANVVAALHADEPAPAVDPTTGEVLGDAPAGVGTPSGEAGSR